MPIRFNSSSLGEGSTPNLKKHQWQIDFTYRYLPGGPWYVGTKATPSAAPEGQPVRIHINSFEVSLDYGVTDRLIVTLDTPFQYGTQSYVYPDLQRHENSAGGLGDIGVYGTYWLLNPKKHLASNLALSLGVKTPSGDNDVMGYTWNAKGQAIPHPVDQSIQLGDGGWGFTFQAQGYKHLFHGATGYANGVYLLSLKDTTNVPSPVAGAVLSVPDVYSVRAGMAYALSPEHHLSVSFGGRIDGIPVGNLVGNSDGFRRPGYNVYLDPGVSYVRGHNIFAVNIPASVHQDFEHSNLDVKIHRVGGGDLASYLILAQYSRRF